MANRFDSSCRLPVQEVKSRTTVDETNSPARISQSSNDSDQKGPATSNYTTSSHQSGSTSQFFLQSVWQVLLLSVTTALFIVTAWFAESTVSVAALVSIDSHLGRALHVNVSSTLTILRIFEGVLSICADTILTRSLELLQWSLASRCEGIGALHSLALSPTTTFLGTVELVFSRHAKLLDRVTAGVRICLLSAIWVSGIVLFIRTQLEVVYEPLMTYNVTAGVGEFNGTYVPEYLQRYQDVNSGYGFTVLPHSTMMTASNLVTNPLYSSSINTVACKEGETCHGFLISGGLSMTTPWPPTNYTSSPVIAVKNIPVVQVDFAQGIHDDSFVDAEDCTSYGGDGYLIGIKFCLARSRSALGALIAGIFVCQQGVVDGECWTDADPPQLTTTMSVYHRNASITTSRVNLTILAIDEVSDPVQNKDLDVEALKQAFGWLFNFTAANIPAPTSIAQYFWTAQPNLESDYWSVEPYQIFHSLLAYPIFLFNPNNVGNVALNSQNITTGLPADFYTTAAIANPYEKIAVDQPMFIIFCVLQVAIIGFAWAVLIWYWLTQPTTFETSSYPLFDFSTKSQFVSSSSRQSRLLPVSVAALEVVTGNQAVRRTLSTCRLVTPGTQHQSAAQSEKSMHHTHEQGTTS